MMEYVADMNMGISFSNYDLTESQKEIVKKYIEYHFISKDEFDKSSKLNQAYLSYSNEISQLIAKSEVYGHDLPDGVFAIKELKKAKRKASRIIKSFRKKSPNCNDLNDISIDLGAVCELSFLKDAYEDADKILSYIEKEYPVIVNNGYNGLRFTKILKHIATALSVFLAITGCISLFNFLLSKI